MVEILGCSKIEEIYQGRRQAMFCAKCGAALPEDVRFCCECGWKVPLPEENQENCDTALQEDEFTAWVEDHLDTGYDHETLCTEKSKRLEQQLVEVSQEYSDTVRMAAAAEKRLKAKHPFYSVIASSFWIGVIIVILSLILAVATGSYYCALLFGFGVLLAIVGSNLEDKVFFSIASSEMKALRKKRRSLMDKQTKLQEQIKKVQKEIKPDKDLF